jgi:hypothetical protein
MASAASIIFAAYYSRAVLLTDPQQCANTFQS